jgi:formylglycine-generating enzyme
LRALNGFVLSTAALLVAVTGVTGCGPGPSPSPSAATDAGPESPSCAVGGPGMTNCGPGGSGTESCCASIEVPGGTFDRTYDPEEADGGGLDVGADGGALGLADPTTVSGFRLDKYLVTVGRFRQFVAAWNGGYYPAAGSGKHTHLNGGQGLQNGGAPGTYETGWDASWDNTTDIDPTDANMAQCEATSGQGVTWTSSVGSNENLPINCTTWWEAYAFCIWDGGFLPSEAEWEYAAAGGGLQLEYPWGSTDPGTANEYAIFNLQYTGSSTGLAPVGTAALGAGHWGHFDLAGEVFEWAADWYDPLYAECNDCAYLTPTLERSARGGEFGEEEGVNFLVPSYRAGYDPTFRLSTKGGIRCARTP